MSQVFYIHLVYQPKRLFFISSFLPRLNFSDCSRIISGFRLNFRWAALLVIPVYEARVRCRQKIATRSARITNWASRHSDLRPCARQVSSAPLRPLTTTEILTRILYLPEDGGHTPFLRLSLPQTDCIAY